MYSTHTRGGYLTEQASIKDQASPLERAHPAHIPKVFVLCDQMGIGPVWGYILRQKGLIVVLETSKQKAIDHWSREMPDLAVLDVDVKSQERMELYRKFREVSATPILLLLPAYHETQILEAYTAGANEVVVKPISPGIFLAKIMAWVRSSWFVPTDKLSLVNAGKYRLDPSRRCLLDREGPEVNLTKLEFRLLHLLMSRPGHIFSAEDMILSIWGAYGSGDQVLLKNVVYRLRKKIEDDPGHPDLLQTWQGGYSFHG